jgi:hypothetical protein
VSASVQIDTRKLDRGLANLTAGLTRSTTARDQADETANALRTEIPVRSGRLRSTVTVSFDGRAAAVNYGGSLPYANYINHRTRAVDTATRNAETAFVARCQRDARKVIDRL